MKKNNDSGIYRILFTIFFAVSLILMLVYLHSKLFVEIPAEKILVSTAHGDKHLEDAYFLLRDPHIFALYDNYDSAGRSSIISIRLLDDKMTGRGFLDDDDRRYLEVLLERRKKGSVLALITSVFSGLVFFVFFLFYMSERKPLYE